MKKSKKKAGKFLNKISKLFGIICTIIHLIFILLIIKLNVVPNKYLLPLIIVTTLILLFVDICLFNKKIKRKPKILSLFTSFIMIIIAGIGIYYMYYTLDFMKNLKSDNSKSEDYYVIVYKDSKMAKLSDIEKSEVNILKIKDESYEKAKDKLKNKVDITYKEIDNVKDIVSNVKNKKVAFISSSAYSILSESPYNIDDISKIIYTVKIKSKLIDITKKVDVGKKPFNVYISGIDTTGNINNVARSDVNMIVTVNPETHEILLTSIPRDYYVTLHSYGQKDKLTHSGIYGINESVTSVEDLLSIDINYYVRVNFSTVTKLVDIIGGIDINSEYTFSTHGMRNGGKKYYFKAGPNHLNGEEALAFSRERKSFRDGDNQRIKNQQIVLTAIIEKITSSKTLLEKYSSILDTMGNSIQTNMDQTALSKLVKNQISDMSSWNISKNSLKGTNSRNVTYSGGRQALFVIEPDPDSLVEAQQQIQTILKNKEEKEKKE